MDGHCIQEGEGFYQQKKDNVLTEKVLIHMLSKDLTYKYHLFDWQEAVDDLADKALGLYVGRALNNKTNEKELDALRSLISNLDVSKVSENKWKEIVGTYSLPPIIRLIAAGKIPTVVGGVRQDLYCEIKKTNG